MSALPYMPFDVSEHLLETAHLTAMQQGAYINLLCYYWQKLAPLNNANERLTNVARTSNDEWTNVKPILAEFFQIDGDIWHHPGLDAKIEACFAKSASARASRQAGIDKKSTSVKRTLNERKSNDKESSNERLTDDERTSDKIKIKNNINILNNNTQDSARVDTPASHECGISNAQEGRVKTNFFEFVGCDDEIDEVREEREQKKLETSNASGLPWNALAEEVIKNHDEVCKMNYAGDIRPLVPAVARCVKKLVGNKNFDYSAAVDWCREVSRWAANKRAGWPDFELSPTVIFGNDKIFAQASGALVDGKFEPPEKKPSEPVRTFGSVKCVTLDAWHDSGLEASDCVDCKNAEKERLKSLFGCVKEGVMHENKYVKERCSDCNPSAQTGEISEIDIKKNMQNYAIGKVKIKKMRGLA